MQIQAPRRVSISGRWRERPLPPRLAVCISTPTYGLYYSQQHSYTQRGRQVDTVAPRDVRVLPKKGGWGAGPLTVSPCPGGSGTHTCTYLELHAD